jgi:isoquinoline 1-oxidoreductase alpha subunit
MARMKLTVNGVAHDVDVDPAMPLLWVLRDVLGLTGTKFGCGIAQCGACTVHAGNGPVRSCVTPVAAVAGTRIRTIEGLSATATGKALQDAWVGEDVAQCGYCQAGMLMEASHLLAKTPHPTADQVDAALAGHICRCGTYTRIRRAVRTALDNPT